MSSGRRGGARVLVADGEEGSRGEIVRTLMDEGYDVVAVSDGAAALESVQATRPDAVVLEVYLPVCPGIDVLEILRRAGWSIPAVLTTKASDASLRRRAEQLGASGLLVRPFDVDELCVSVHGALARARGEDAAESATQAAAAEAPVHRAA